MFSRKQLRADGRAKGGGSSPGRRAGRTHAIFVMLAGLSMVIASFQFIHVELASSHKMLPGELTSAPRLLPAESPRGQTPKNLVPVRKEGGDDPRLSPGTTATASSPLQPAQAGVVRVTDNLLPVRKEGADKAVDATGKAFPVQANIAPASPICHFHTLPKELCKSAVIFMAPAPFTGERAARQERAVRSWLQAAPFNVTIVFFVNEISAVEFAESRGIYYLCVDSTVDGLPRFDAMISTMRKMCDNTVMGLANSDIVLRDPAALGSAIRSLKAFGWKEHPLREAHPFMKFTDKLVHGRPFFSECWFAVSERFDLLPDGQEKKHMAGGYDFWLWNEVPSRVPLIDVAIPPFW